MPGHRMDTPGCAACQSLSVAVALSPLDLAPSGRCPCGDSARQRSPCHPPPFPGHSRVAPRLSECGLAWGGQLGLVALAQGSPGHSGGQYSVPQFPLLSHTSPIQHFPLPPRCGGFSKKHFVRGTFFFFLKEIKYFICIYIYVLQSAP